MQNFEQIAGELERRGKAEQLRRLADSREGAQLAGMLDADALERARAGDGAALQKILGTVLGTSEGRRLAENIRRMMED